MIYLVFFAIPLFAIARRLTGGPAPKWVGVVITVLVSLLVGWTSGAHWTVWVTLAGLSWSHFTYDHADDWRFPWKILNVGRYSFALAIWAIGPAFASEWVSVAACALAGVLSAASYWFVQQPRIRDYLDGLPDVPMPWGQNQFLDGHLGYAELAFGFWWGAAVCVTLARM